MAIEKILSIIATRKKPTQKNAHTEKSPDNKKHTPKTARTRKNANIQKL